MFDYDAELTRYNVRLREAAGVRPDDRVLDIGCGTGLTTREAARSATSGSALGVDLSPQMLDRARAAQRARKGSRTSASSWPTPRSTHSLRGISLWG